ncbi:MAG TPA: hypothetical protein VFE60_20105 [Roseiarcus sp.]|jgi:hypothetical protein|nr:hypothetical protein [Roseiarcus sp.]
MPQPNALRLVIWITISSSLLGAMFAYARTCPTASPDFVNTELQGVVTGGLNGGILSSLEILVLRGAYGAPSANCRFYSISRCARFSTWGILLVLIASNLRVGITRGDIAFSLALSGFNLQLGVNDLLGPGVLFAFVAERLGEERFLDFLNRFITDLSLAIAEAGGKSTNMSATRSLVSDLGLVSPFTVSFWICWK